MINKDKKAIWLTSYVNWMAFFLYDLNDAHVYLYDDVTEESRETMIIEAHRRGNEQA